MPKKLQVQLACDLNGAKCASHRIPRLVPLLLVLKQQATREPYVSLLVRANLCHSLLRTTLLGHVNKCQFLQCWKFFKFQHILHYFVSNSLNMSSLLS